MIEGFTKLPVYIHSNSTLLTLAGMLNSILHVMYARKCERMKRNGCVISERALAYYNFLYMHERAYIISTKVCFYCESFC